MKESNIWFSLFFFLIKSFWKRNQILDKKAKIQKGKNDWMKAQRFSKLEYTMHCGSEGAADIYLEVGI